MNSKPASEPVADTKARRTASISVRTTSEIRAAVDKAAEDDERSVSNYVSRLLELHLKKTGYLRPLRVVKLKDRY